MLTALNRSLFAHLVAPDGLQAVPLFAAVGLAQWAILIVPAVLVLAWSAGTEDRRAAVAAAMAGGLGVVAAAGLSLLIDAPRPFVAMGAVNYLDHVRDSGFPSDRVTLIVAVSLALRLRRPPGMPWLWAPLLVLAGAVGWARVFLGAHAPADIAGAVLLGALAAAILASRQGRTLSNRIAAVGEWLLAAVPRRRSTRRSL